MGLLDSGALLSRTPSDSAVTHKVVPLVARVEGTERRLVGLLVLGECEQAEALTELLLARIASDLMERDDDTAVL